VIANFRSFEVKFKNSKKIKKIIYTNVKRKDLSVKTLKAFEVIIAELD
jgi:hypothetical protein